MNINNAKIKKILLDESYVSEEDIQRAEEIANKEKISLAEALTKEKIITHSLLGQAIAEYFKLPFVDIKAHPPTREQVLKIPEEIAKKHRVVLFEEGDKEITIATDNPEQPNLLEHLKTGLKGKKIKLVYAVSDDIDEIFIHYRKSLKTRFAAIIEEQDRVAPEIIDEIFEDAVTFNTSDIHFEPQGEETVIRFRIDGVMQESGRIEKEYYESMLNRIKVQANLRIDEHFAPQDGAIRHTLKKGATVDMRVSIIPTLDGEKIVIRLLSQYVRSFTLSDLGLSATDQEKIQKAAKKPFGMILVTGPTGSGKTTTLYAVLKILNSPDVNITTIEDPVEYKMLGTSQIQVNQRTDLTFAKGLRSIVRQDPDIILVGEIRDQITAEIAVNAALTGHLLLSSFHANDSATALPRLLDMGIEPFLLASTLEVVVAQRLVRRICPNCRFSKEVSIEELEKMIPNPKQFFKDKKVNLYEGKGCDACGNTGYTGRQAIFEFIEITSEMEDLILKNPSTQQIWELAKTQGAHTLFEDGMEKVKNGVTTLKELLRVANPN